jgi:hypothetical protein
MIRCCFHNCEQPATVLIVNTEDDTFPFATGAGTPPRRSAAIGRARASRAGPSERANDR